MTEATSDVRPSFSARTSSPRWRHLRPGGILRAGRLVEVEAIADLRLLRRRGRVSY